jgi:hypothetical protein
VGSPKGLIQGARGVDYGIRPAKQVGSSISADRQGGIMPRNTDRILATHVGSLIRPPKLIEFLRKIEGGQPYDKEAYEICLKTSIAEVVRQQADIGIDIVSDGEFGKGKTWAFYIHDRLTGIVRQPISEQEASEALGGRDRRAFPEFYALGLEGSNVLSHRMHRPYQIRGNVGGSA